MKLFINDKPVCVVDLDECDGLKFDEVFDKKDDIVSKQLVGNVLFENASTAQVDRLLKLLESKKLKKLESITLAVENPSLMKEYIKDCFKIIKAAGGIVTKGDKILMIYRLGKWDFPKGKLKKKEDSLEGARREVEEECNITVGVGRKIGPTWHTYMRKGKRILKKTIWYQMHCIDDSNMQPQTEEFIEEVRWMNKMEVQAAMKGTYKSIEEISNNYFSTVGSL
ncbi:MAG: NUDIX hydrolase [Cytophagaceae bacterium]